MSQLRVMSTRDCEDKSACQINGYKDPELVFFVKQKVIELIKMFDKAPDVQNFCIDPLEMIEILGQKITAWKSEMKKKLDNSELKSIQNEKKCSGFESTIKNLSTDVGFYRSKTNRSMHIYQGEYNKLQKKIQDKDKEIMDLCQQIEYLNEKNEQSLKKLAEFQSQCDSLRIQLKKSKNDSFQSDKSLKKEVNYHLATKNALRREMQALKLQITELSDGRQRSQSLSASLKESIRQKDTKIDQLRNQCHCFYLEKEKFSVQLKESQKKAAESHLLLVQRCEQFEKRYNKVERNLNEFQQKIITTMAEFSEIRPKVQFMLEQSSIYGPKMEGFHERIRRLTDKINEQNTKNLQIAVREKELEWEEKLLQERTEANRKINQVVEEYEAELEKDRQKGNK